MTGVAQLWDPAGPSPWLGAAWGYATPVSLLLGTSVCLLLSAPMAGLFLLPHCSSGDPAGYLHPKTVLRI